MRTRTIRIEGDIAIVPLTQGLVAIVDAADAHLVAGRNWCASKYGKTFYAMTNIVQDGRRTSLKMHRAILREERGPRVDHRDGNGLNNRRANLRPATSAENLWNRAAQRNSTSGLKGVSYDRRSGKWRAEISAAGKRVSLGLFPNPSSAAAAYAAAAERLHGDFARVS